MSRNRTKRRAKPYTRGNTAIVESTIIPLDDQMIPLSLYEARGRRIAARGAAASKSFSLAWDETEAMGITADMRRSGPGMLSDQDRKQTLYDAYLNSVWISACVDVIAKRITSGGMVIELTEHGKENQAEYDELHTFLHYINEDEDFLQLIRSIVTDLLIYGEAYMEIVRKNGKPFSLHKIDCITMNYVLDKHGQVVKYVQNMTHSTETIEFQPDEVIRWWMPDPKASKKALSPIERILGSVDADTHMADWVRAFFRKGARPPFWIKFKGSQAEAARFVTWLRENYTGQANAHVPLVLYEEAELHEVGKGAVDMDYSKGRAMMRQEILAGYQVPPAIVSQIESGNLGGGTGESQDKSFQFNACDPVKQLIFEKFNYRIVTQGFKSTNYRVDTRYADFRADGAIVEVQQKRIFSGLSLPDEERQAMGRAPYPKGGDIPIVVSGKEIVPLERLDELAGEQRQQAQIGLQQAQAQLDMTKVQVDKAKNPPPPPPTMVQQAPPPDKKDEKEQQQQQERRLHALQDALLRTNETLARVDEHLRIARGAQESSTEIASFKQALIGQLQWLKEDQIVFVDQVKEQLARMQSLIEAKQEESDEENAPCHTETNAQQSEEAREADASEDRTDVETNADQQGAQVIEAQHHTGIIHGEKEEIAQVKTVIERADPWIPPEAVRSACRHGLELHGKGLSGDGLEPITVTWARKFAHGERCSPEKARQGNRWFGRNSRFADEPHDSPAYVALLLWGGLAGKSWFAHLVQLLDSPEQESVVGDDVCISHKIEEGGNDESTQDQTLSQDTQSDAQFTGANEDTGNREDGTLREADAQHWQDTDRTIQDAIKKLAASGVTHLTWNAHSGACDECLANHGQKVKVGERFKSGAYYTPNHGNCGCECRESKEHEQ